MLQAEEPVQGRSSVPQPWETLVWSSVKDETQAHRKLVFIISKAQGATCFLCNPNSFADLETNMATTITKMSVVVPIILCTCFLYLFLI